MKKKYIATVVIAFLLVLALLVGARAVESAEDGMFNWYDPCGYTCYQWADGSGDCYPCNEGETCYVPTSNPTPTPNVPRPLPTSEPTKECRPGWGYGDDNHCHSGPPGQSK